MPTKESGTQTRVASSIKTEGFLTVAIHSLGCKVNHYEASAIIKMFMAANYRVVGFEQEADVYIINTCSVTNNADSKSRQKIRQAIKQNKDAIVCVIGCYAQVDPNNVIKIEGVDIVLGNQQKDKLVDLVEKHIEDRDVRNQQNLVSDIMKQQEFENLIVDSFTENTRAFLKIQDGCNNYCTYCIIPYARGKMRSLKKELVIKQMQQLVNNGYQEIVLTGIHTGGYGVDLEDYSLEELLKDILNEVKGLKRLRISSIEINQLTKGIIELFKTNKIMANHLHIPLQSGSDDVLNKMKRKYNTKQFKDKINEIKKELKDIAITTDVIVGFPEETDENFSETYQLCKEIEFAKIHVFPYSPRQNTPAANMKQVHGLTKQKRVKTLMLLSERLQHNYAKKFINTKQVVIVEQRNELGLIGYSSNYLKVIIDEDDYFIQKMVTVNINSVDKDNCFGGLINGT